MNKHFLSTVVIILPIIFSSCVSNPSYFNKSVIDRANDKIAVLPFRNFNSVEGNNSGELIRSVFETRLRLKRFNVVDIEKSASSIDYSLIAGSEFQGKWAIEAGKTLNVDYIIFGSVHDYRTYNNQTSFFYIFSWVELTSSVGVTARMISSKTGEVVWSGTFTRASFTYNDAAIDVSDSLIRSIKFKKSENR